LILELIVTLDFHGDNMSLAVWILEYGILANKAFKNICYDMWLFNKYFQIMIYRNKNVT